MRYLHGLFVKLTSAIHILFPPPLFPLFHRFNYDSLVNIPKEERRERLQETFEGVMEDYERIISGERREID